MFCLCLFSFFCMTLQFPLLLTNSHTFSHRSWKRIGVSTMSRPRSTYPAAQTIVQPSQACTRCLKSSWHFRSILLRPSSAQPGQHLPSCYPSCLLLMESLLRRKVFLLMPRITKGQNCMLFTHIGCTPRDGKWQQTRIFLWRR